MQIIYLEKLEESGNIWQNFNNIAKKVLHSLGCFFPFVCQINNVANITWQISCLVRLHCTTTLNWVNILKSSSKGLCVNDLNEWVNELSQELWNTPLQLEGRLSDINHLWLAPLCHHLEPGSLFHLFFLTLEGRKAQVDRLFASTQLMETYPQDPKLGTEYKP